MIKLAVLILLLTSPILASAQEVSTLVPSINASGGISFGPDGNIYVADFGILLNNPNGTTVYKVTPQGTVSTFATGFTGASGNDFDTAAMVKEEIRSQYQGPLSLATDFMVWNISRDKLTTRMAVANPESFPPPAQVPAIPPVVDENTYQWDPYSFTGLEKRTSAVTNEVVKEFNARHGTNVEPVLSSMTFKN